MTGQAGRTEQEQRHEFADGLRVLADVLEAVPEVPLPGEIARAVPGLGDDEQSVVLASLTRALAEEKIPHRYAADEHTRRVSIMLGPVEYRLSAVWDAAMARHKARDAYLRELEKFERQGVGR